MNYKSKIFKIKWKMKERAYGLKGKKEARGWRAYYPYTTGEFIRDYLQEKGEAYIHETWMAFQDDLREYGLEWWGSTAASGDTFTF